MERVGLAAGKEGEPIEMRASGIKKRGSGADEKKRPLEAAKDAPEPTAVEFKNPGGGTLEVKIKKLESLRTGEAKIKTFKSRALRHFYNKQNQLIDGMLNDLNRSYSVVDGDDEKGGLAGEVENEEKDDDLIVKVAITGSLVLNICLFALKLTAAVTSGSVTIIASTVDSALDLASGYVLHATQKLIESSDPYMYPQGRNRLEPVGIVIFACIMSLASIQIILEGAKQLLFGFLGDPPEVSIGIFGISVLSVTVGTKVLAYIYCSWVAKKVNSSSAEAYAQDHINDSMTNTVGIVVVLLVVTIPSLWFLDAIGGIVISIWVVVSWVESAKEQIQYLTGRSANPMLLQRITHAAFCHHNGIEKVDTVRAYHFGRGFLVEVDLVMDEKTPLKEAHDVGESLQIKLEKMEEVERAFVHLDYEYDHAPEH